MVSMVQKRVKFVFDESSLAKLSELESRGVVVFALNTGGEMSKRPWKCKGCEVSEIKEPHHSLVQHMEVAHWKFWDATAGAFADGERKVIHPQPRNGPPFKLNASGLHPHDWYNQRLGRFANPLLFSWRCPYGEHGRPKLIDGVWYWVKPQ